MSLKMRKLNCNYVDRRIADFISGRLSRRDYRIIDHIGDCGKCFDSFRFQYELYKVYHPEALIRERRIWNGVMKILEQRA